MKAEDKKHRTEEPRLSVHVDPVGFRGQGTEVEKSGS